MSGASDLQAQEEPDYYPKLCAGAIVTTDNTARDDIDRVCLHDTLK